MIVIESCFYGTCLPVNPWQMTFVSLLIHTLADADMLRVASAVVATVLMGTRAIIFQLASESNYVERGETLST